MIFVTPDKAVGFWFVEKMGKPEGMPKRDIIAERIPANV
jgi:hypothetical protein